MSIKEIVFIAEEALEGGCTASALGHAIFTEADSWLELKDMIRDAVKCHFEEKEDRKSVV